MTPSATPQFGKPIGDIALAASMRQLIGNVITFVGAALVGPEPSDREPLEVTTLYMDRKFAEMERSRGSTRYSDETFKTAQRTALLSLYELYKTARGQSNIAPPVPYLHFDQDAEKAAATEVLGQPPLEPPENTSNSRLLALEMAHFNGLRCEQRFRFIDILEGLLRRGSTPAPPSAARELANAFTRVLHQSTIYSQREIALGILIGGAEAEAAREKARQHLIRFAGPEMFEFDGRLPGYIPGSQADNLKQALLAS